MAFSQAVVGNPGGQVVNVVVGDIDGKPVQPARQDQKAGALYRRRDVVPTLVAARVGMLEIMLHRKQHQPRSSGQRCAGYVHGKKQRGSDDPGHQRPCAQQHGVVPEHLPIFLGGGPIGRLEFGRMRLDGCAGLSDFPFEDVTDKADAALQPGKARVPNHVQKSRNGAQPDAARALIPALLPVGHGGIFLDRHDGQGSAVFRPIAVGRMVKGMMLRPDVLRHAPHHAEDESERLVEPGGAKQAPVAAVVHQQKSAQHEQAHRQGQAGGQPVGDSGAQRGGIPKGRKRRQRRKSLRKSPEVVGFDMPIDEGPFLLLDAGYRRHG